MLCDARRHDADSSGYLNISQVVSLVEEVLPDASPLDCAHVAAVLDMNSDTRVTLEEFMTTLEEGSAIAEAVRALLRARVHGNAV